MGRALAIAPPRRRLSTTCAPPRVRLGKRDYMRANNGRFRLEERESNASCKESDLFDHDRMASGQSR
jgi:hypothetical protein